MRLLDSLSCYRNLLFKSCTLGAICYTIGMNSLPAERDKYSILIKRIKQEIAQGLDRAQRAYAREKVITYWKIGQAISKHLLENKERADYGKQLYAQIGRAHV